MSIILQLAKGARYLSGTIASLAIGLLCIEVITRYFAPLYLPDWSTEVVIYLTIWSLFLVAGELAIEGSHVRADFLINRLSSHTKHFFNLLASFLGLAFALLFLWYGWKVVTFAYMIDERGESSLRIAKYLYYLALPIGMFLQILGYSVRIKSDLKIKKTEEIG